MTEDREGLQTELTVSAKRMWTGMGCFWLNGTVEMANIQESVPDALLVQEAQAGSLEAFEALTRRYEGRVYSLAMRMLRHEHDAKDVTQQTFLSALEGLDSFRGEASFSTWLFRIASHAALKVIRKRKGLETVSLEEATTASGEDGKVPHPEYISDWKQSPDNLVHQNETRKLLEHALAQLDEKHRLVFLLRDVEGLSIKETAEALELSEANTKVRLLRARLHLREILTRALGDPSTRVERGHHHPHAHPAQKPDRPVRTKRSS